MIDRSADFNQARSPSFDLKFDIEGQSQYQNWPDLMTQRGLIDLFMKLWENKKLMMKVDN